MRGIEGDLLDFGKVVLGVLVQDEFANLAERELVVGPDVGEIEDVDLVVLPELFGLLGRHGLYFERPLGAISLVDRVVEVLGRVVGSVVGAVLLGDETSALLGDHVELAVHPFADLIGELDGVSKIAVHLTITVWNTSITHQNHDLVNRLWVL